MTFLKEKVRGIQPLESLKITSSFSHSLSRVTKVYYNIYCVSVLFHQGISFIEEVI